MRYFKTEEKLIKVFGNSAKLSPEMSGYEITGNSQMRTKGKMISYGTILNETLFTNNVLLPDEIVYFETVEELEIDVDLEYEEELILKNPVALQLDLQLSKKTEIKDYDAALPIESQFNLKKIKEDNMGGVIIGNKKAKVR